jgi:hypothetical protein
MYSSLGERLRERPFLLVVAPRHQGAPRAGRSPRPVGDDLAPAPYVLGVAQGPQGLPGRADVEILFGIVGELALAEEAHAPPGLVQHQVGTDARVLDGPYVLSRPVLAVGGDVVGPQLPPEGTTEEQVEHGAVLADFAWGDQHGEDDARLASVHYVVGLVA